MKTKPKPGQKVWWIIPDAASASDFSIHTEHFSEDMDYKFNLFPTRKEAEAARKKIVQILRG